MKSISSKLHLVFIFFLIMSCSNGIQNEKSSTNDPGREFNDIYKGKYLNRVAFPVGGIGAGMFCIEGTGAISHMSVRNKPEVFNEPCMFAAISIKGLEHGAKVLEGPVPDWKKFGQPHTGTGATGASYGFPRFRDVRFLPRFPFCYFDLADEDIPLEIKVTGWSPFIPADADNSSLPVGALEYTFKNNSNAALEAVFSYNTKNFMAPGNRGTVKSLDNGFILAFEGGENNTQPAGNFAIFTNEPQTVIDHCWFRGGHFDPITMAWKTIHDVEMRESEPVEGVAPGASLYIPVKLGPNEEKTVRLMMCWYVPESNLRYGQDLKNEKECTDPSCLCNMPYHKPWYSGRFTSIKAVADYWKMNYDDLRRKSEIFKESFYNSTLPPEVIEAVAANLTILKSPTVLRQIDGKLWSYEGCGDDWGCCSGSCTHVWNYAQAIPHLFPKLERSLRETEFFYSQNEEGHQVFRAALPIRHVAHTFYAAADGQLGGIMKVYREWHISGDKLWLKKIFPHVKASMDYCIQTWDPKHKGIVEEPHHNTYDIEFWGPDGMCTSFYMGALQAISEMGTYLNDDTSFYRELLEKGNQYMDNALFNGEYYIQKVQWEGLNSPDPVELSKTSWSVDYSDEAITLLQKEGPKYQYGNGCLSDGILGCWIARVCGLKLPLNEDNVVSHLNSVYNYNLVHNLETHENPQRASFASGNEGGLLLCTWPGEGQPSLPFVYSNEVWTGIEYQVASHLMFMGEVEKGLDIVRTCRKRYDGRVRNPFNEFECGHWYARAMSSYGLLEGLTGVRYDAVDNILYIDSKVGDFTSFLSTETGFGNIGLKGGKPFADIVFGDIDFKKVMVSGKEMTLTRNS